MKQSPCPNVLLFMLFIKCIQIVTIFTTAGTDSDFPINQLYQGHMLKSKYPSAL